MYMVLYILLSVNRSLIKLIIITQKIYLRDIFEKLFVLNNKLFCRLYLKNSWIEMTKQNFEAVK